MNKKSMISRIKFLCSLLLLLISARAGTQGSAIPLFFIDHSADEYDLTGSLVYLEGGGEESSLNQIITRTEDFVTYTPQISLDPKKVYWAGCRILVDPSLNKDLENWILYVGECDYFEVYQLDNGLDILSSQMGESLLPEESKSIRRGNHVKRVNIDLASGEENYIFIKYSRKNQQRIQFDVRLSKYDFFQSWDFLKDTRRDWFFLGFIFTMLLFNILYFILTKAKAFLYHGLFILGVILFTLDFFGITPDLWFIRDHPEAIQLIDYLALALIDISYFQFVRYFLELKQNDPKWDWRFGWIVKLKLLFFTAIILFHYWTFNEPLADSIVALFLSAGFLFTIIFISAIYKGKDIKIRFVLGGTIVIFLAIVLNAYSILRGQGLWILFTEIGLALEITLFSVALAYRLKMLREEEQKAKMVLEVDALKNKFFTNISHEFRTPLTIINGVSEVAKEKIRSLDTGGLFDSLQKIRNQSDKLLNLVNQILGLTKLETKTLKINFQNIELVSWLENVSSDFSEYALQKGLDLIFSTSADRIYINVDALQLKTIVSNLISNAIKFTPPGGRIDVICIPEMSEGRDGVTVQIKDTGIGISKENQSRIFDRFYQVDDHSQSVNSGLGVGLAMCKEIINLLGGDITVSSILDKGATFRVWLPLASKPADMIQPTSEDEVLEFTFPMTHEEKPLALVIDDNADILEFLEEMLRERYTILTALNGKDGLEKAISQLPDIIIADIMMPIMDGFELCEKLKSDKKTDHIPIILLTAKTEEVDRLRGWEKGADAFLTKPFERQELELIIDNLYSSRKLLQKRYSDFTFVEDKEMLKKESSFIQNIHRILEDNIENTELSVEELARQMFMSRMQLHRKIKALSNKSASHYIRSYRLHKAKLMLKDLNISVSDVAYDVGFQSPNYFSRSFHHEFGLTPTEYRESLL